jgi:hypothetical protein
MRNKDFSGFGHPVFILSVAALILNDWCLKPAFHNALTGKLSDFAGLLAFPFFLSVLFPRCTNGIHAGTAVFFIWWKCELSEPFLEFLNDFGFPAHRVVDPSDNVALVSIILSLFLLRQKRTVTSSPVILCSILVVASFAFMATTMPRAHLRKFVSINKEYHFDISKKELVSRLNSLQLKEISIASKMSGGKINFNNETNTFHFDGSTDTLALILDHTKIADTDTIKYKTSFAEIMIAGNEQASVLKLVSVYQYVTIGREQKDFGESAIKAFEKHIVRKMKRFPEPFRQKE